MGFSDLMTLADAGRIVPGGPVSRVAVWSWANRGILSTDKRRVRLEVVKVGRRLMTSQEQLFHFFKEAGRRANTEGAANG